MKKYLFSVLFFLGCFFVCLIQGSTVANAAPVADSIIADSQDGRIITINLSGLNARTEVLKVYQIEMCQEGEEGCESPTVGDVKVYFRKLDIPFVEYQLPTRVTSATITYTINSNSDGVKYLYIEANWSGNAHTTDSCIVEYTLSTINQRIVINPDGDGNPLHVYDGYQYSPSRVLNINVELFQDEIDNTYSGQAYIFEEGVKKYSYWLVNEGTFSFGLESYGDGLKNLTIYLVKKGKTIDESLNVLNQLDSNGEVNAKKITKKIYLDTIGPEITVDGGSWVVVPVGENYSAQTATCKDATFANDECSVINDLDIIRLNRNSEKYQIVTYEATDRLGNTKTVNVRVKFEQKADNSGIYISLIVGGSILIVTGSILAYILIKNHEKKKKISYI